MEMVMNGFGKKIEKEITYINGTEIEIFLE